MIKPKVLLIIDSYLPGFKGGGPIQSVRNMINSTMDAFDYYILTSNHDFHERQVYDNIKTDEWNEVFGIKIFYSSDEHRSKNIRKIMKSKEFSLIFLNSFFSLNTIRVLLTYRIFKISIPVILMPRGELSEGALNLKRFKKLVYLKFATQFDFLRDINYFATAQDEYEQIKKLLKVNNITKVSNIPNTKKVLTLNTKVSDILKIVFVSRITKKKNLNYALRSLLFCKTKISFDIYGTIEDKEYWSSCEKIIKSLPDNITVMYRGELINKKVIDTLANYDLFYFPTKSENYGHVISEALQASVPVLLSDTTPWIDLEEKELGWVYSLSEPKYFSERIDILTKIKTEDFNNIKQKIYENFNVESKANKTGLEYIEMMKQITLIK